MQTVLTLEKNRKKQLGSISEYSGLYCTTYSGLNCTMDSGVKCTTFQKSFLV